MALIVILFDGGASIGLPALPGGRGPDRLARRARHVRDGRARRALRPLGARPRLDDLWAARRGGRPDRPRGDVLRLRRPRDRGPHRHDPRRRVGRERPGRDRADARPDPARDARRRDVLGRRAGLLRADGDRARRSASRAASPRRGCCRGSRFPRPRGSTRAHARRRRLRGVAATSRTARASSRCSSRV